MYEEYEFSQTPAYYSIQREQSFQKPKLRIWLMKSNKDAIRLSRKFNIRKKINDEFSVSMHAH